MGLLVLIPLIGAAMLAPFIYLKEAVQITEVVIPSGGTERVEFIHGSWPALERAQFFEVTKQRYVSEKTGFIEADLSAMRVRVYRDGLIAAEVPIISKGKSGSWWETPAGLYKIETKEKKHYSSFGHVYMPWSMAFQGNFFIHGWPYYDNGSPVPEGYSGGCIRLSTEDAKMIFALAEVGMPVLVFEQSFAGTSGGEDFSYALKEPIVNASSYLAADLSNNFVFAQKASDGKRSIASITKLMTALVAVEYVNVEREVAITSSMTATTSIPRLRSGDTHTVLDLLSVLLMESSNEAARAIAEPLGRIRFMHLMNNKAAAIGMEHSAFVDTSGVLGDNVSTAQDLFMLAKYFYYNRSFVLHMTVGNENRIAYGASAFRNVKNLNEIPQAQGMIGGKMGISTSAGNSMLAVFEVEIGGQKRPVAIIALGSDDAKRDIQAILQHIQASYERGVLPLPGDLLKQ